MYITDRISMKKLNSPVKIGLDFKTNTKKKKIQLYSDHRINT